MLGENPDELQRLHFDTLTLSPTRANWVKRLSKAQVISFINPTMWVSFARDGKTQLGTHAMVPKRGQ
jgi:hypothetical protein